MNLPMNITHACCIVFAAATLALTQPLRAADETVDSAVWLLKKATLVHPNGMHNVLLRALRQLQDPELQPLFSELVQKRHPVLRIHGILGLGEINASKQIELQLISDTKDIQTQTQLISSAIEGKLLGVDAAKQLLAWPGLDVTVKTVVAAYLIGEKQPVDPAVLDQALASENLGIRCVAALLKLQLGDARAMQHIQALDNSPDASRDAIRSMLLQTAIRYRFASVAPWALKLAAEPGAPQSITFLALRAAILFGAPEGREIWAKRLESSTGVADRIRYALLGMDLADKLGAQAFNAMLKDEQELVRQMGAVAQALASGKDAAAESLKLLELNNVLTSQWVIQQATDKPLEKSRPLLLGIIRHAEAPPNDARFRAQRLSHVVSAAQHIAENVPDARAVFAELFASSPLLTQEAMLMGLIRSQAKSPHLLIEGVTTWSSEPAESLALLLRAKNAVPLDDAGMQRLQLIVRGGAGLEDPLRVQAAWIYLKRTGQEKFALASVLGK